MLGRALLASLIAAVVADASHRAPPRLVIEHVGVVDVVAGKVVEDADVYVEGGQIRSVTTDRVTPTSGATVIDGRGKYLIPALWDMHVHVTYPAGAAPLFLSLMVANGVLGAREMHGFLPVVLALRDSVRRRNLLGPRLFVAGTAIDGPTSFLPAARIVKTPDEARAAVRDLKNKGVDFIKVYSSLPRDSYFAVADEARKIGIPFLGHVPYAVTAVEASNAGQRSMEHLLEVDVATSNEEAAIKAEEADAMAHGHGYLVDAARLRSSYDSAKAKALFALLRRNNTWQVPTLLVVYKAGQAASENMSTDSLLVYIPKGLRDYWMSFPVDINAKEGAVYGFRSDLVGHLNRAGVSLLAGSDCPNAFVYPGFAIHQELQLLVRAGLTPTEALRAATINAARFLGVTDSLGVVAPGKIADLVLLDANPLTDISNTQRIRAVIQGGRVLNRASLDQILARAKTLAATGNH
jgi:imidazolonepropionase-like amidohydrolase